MPATRTADDSLPRFTTGDLLRRARRNAGLDQIELAEKTGIPRSTIGARERDVGHLTVNELWLIAEATGQLWLYREAFKKPPPKKKDRKRRSSWCGVLAGQELAGAAA